MSKQHAAKKIPGTSLRSYRGHFIDRVPTYSERGPKFVWNCRETPNSEAYDSADTLRDAKHWVDVAVDGAA